MKNTYLIHHGIKGQKWGVRRYQNEDGSLTPAGVSRYGTVENFNETRARNKRRAIGIGIGVGAAAAVAGGIYLARKNKKLSNELGSTKGELGAYKNELSLYKAKEARTLKNLEAGRAKRMANIAAGIAPNKTRIPKGADLVVSATSKKGIPFVKEMFNVGGGYIVGGIKK